MRDRTWIALVFAGLALAGALAPFAAAWWLGESSGPARGLAAVLVAALFGIAWWRVDRLVLAPAGRLSEAVEAWLRLPGSGRELPSPGAHALDRLPEAVAHLAGSVDQQRRALRDLSRSAADQAEEQRSWLDVALRDLSESVVVCDPLHRVLFHNQAAERMLGGIADGHALSVQVPRAALDHAFDSLTARMAALGGRLDGNIGTALFSCLIRNGRRVAHGQMSLVRGARHGITGYVVVFRDLSEGWAGLDPHDAAAQALTRDLRGPLGALHAAAQMLADYPDMEAGDRDRFVQVIGEECARLRGRVDTLAQGRAVQSGAVWPMADIHFSELFACVSRTLGQRLDLNLTMVGVPLWLHGDSHSLMEALLALFAALHAATGRSDFDMECMLGDRRVYVDINWKGEPVPDGRLTAWLEGEINTQLGPQRVKDVLERHDSQPWSLAKRGGFAALRLPLPLPRRPQFTEAEWSGLGAPPSLPEAERRAALLLHAVAGGFGSRALDQVPFVVVAADLPPDASRDGRSADLAALGAVRVEDGRLLTAHTFERRIAPSSSVDAGGRPPLAVVLPQFWAFAGESVLAAHDIAPILGLLEQGRAEGRTIPVIDIPTLSLMLDPDEDDHRLAAIARRLGIRVGDHRTEIGRALIAAEILVRLLDRLRLDGISRFDRLVEAARARLSRPETLEPVE